MTDAPLRKRDREPEALPDSIDVREPKRLHGEETDMFLHLLQLDQTLADEDDELEEFAPCDELVNGVMRSLEEEIAVTCSTSLSSSDSADISAASDSFVGQESETIDSDFGFDLSYLLEASDDELGIPPRSVQDLKDKVSLSTKETSEGLLDNPDLKSLGENWHFKDGSENYEQLAVYEDPWDENQLLQDYMSRDFVSESILFDGYFSPAWRLEIASGL